MGLSVKLFLKGDGMKTYKFKANCKTKESAIDFAKEPLRDFCEDPKEFEIKANKLKRKDVQ